MDGDATAADAARAMKTATRYQQQMARRGRFGRDVRTLSPTDDVPTGEEPITLGLGVYMIDANAVAEAILARLIAGRTFPPPPRP